MESRTTGPAAIKRRPLEGVWNILRFNWHFFAIVGVIVVVGVVLWAVFANPVAVIIKWGVLLLFGVTLIPVIVSYFVYDRSDLYKFAWLRRIASGHVRHIVNVHAGFDETSNALEKHFPYSQLTIFDFYDPEAHTEPSIRRARKAYAAYPGTRDVRTSYLPLPDNDADLAFAILTGHEIRDHTQRVAFFMELKRIVSPVGKIVVVEHLRDTANFIAYNIGFMHFLPRKTWKDTFDAAGIRIERKFKITPFITVFILYPNQPC